MRKEYVTPTIEGEVFEANEYVAACWVVTCTGGEQMLVYKQPNFDYRDGDQYVSINGEDRYFGTINGKRGEQNASLTGSKFWDWVLSWFGFEGDPYHSVSVTSGANGNAASLNSAHPNASA